MRLAQTPMLHLSALPPSYAHSVVASDEEERATAANGYGSKAALESKLSPQHRLGRTARVLGHAAQTSLRSVEHELRARADPEDGRASRRARGGGEEGRAGRRADA
jgi:hypothetical protein